MSEQVYLPDPLRNAKYYQPTDRGEEAVLSQVWSKIRSILGRD